MAANNQFVNNMMQGAIQGAANSAVNDLSQAANGIINSLDAPVFGSDPNKWVKEDCVRSCQNCGTDFSLFFRRRRCRVCGGVFCKVCAENKIYVQGVGESTCCFPCFSAHSKLTTEQQTMVEEICKEVDEQATMRTMVLLKWDGGSRNHSILVVTLYRVLFLKRSTKKIYKNEKLLDLASIEMQEAGRVTLGFRKQDGPILEQQQQLEVNFVTFETSRAPEVIHALQTHHLHIFNGNPPPQCVVSVKVRPEWLLPLQFIHDPNPLVGGFNELYRAYCNYYCVPPSDDLLRYITETTTERPFVLNLSDCPGIDSTSEIAIEPKPIFSALRYNKYFLSIEINDVSLAKLMELLSDTMNHNTTITTLLMTNLSVKYVTLLGNSLRINSKNIIQEFDFSGTYISDKAMTAFALSLTTREYGIKQLKFGGSQLSAKALTSLIRDGLIVNEGVANSIEYFDLSGNKFDEESSTMLQACLAKMGSGGNLKTFSVAKSNAILDNIVTPLAAIYCLENLDFSGNTMSAGAAKQLAALISTSQHLKTLNLSACFLDGHSMGLIVSALSQNNNLRNTDVNLSLNVINNDAARIVASSIGKVGIIKGLDLSECSFEDDGFLNICSSLAASGQMTDKLVLQNFISHTTSHISGTRIGHAIADTLLQMPTIKSLSISAVPPTTLGQVTTYSQTLYTGYYAGKQIDSTHVVIPLLQRLQRNDSLTELDVSGNKLGDMIAVALSETIRQNTSLVKVSCDNNRISITGYKALWRAIKQNRTIQQFTYPVQDTVKLVTTQPPAKLQKLYRILSDIEIHCHDNIVRYGRHARLAVPPIADPPSQPLPLGAGNGPARTGSYTVKPQAAPTFAAPTVSATSSPSSPAAKSSSAVKDADDPWANFKSAVATDPTAVATPTAYIEGQDFHNSGNYNAAPTQEFHAAHNQDPNTFGNYGADYHGGYNDSNYIPQPGNWDSYGQQADAQYANTTPPPPPPREDDPWAQYQQGGQQQY